MLQTPCNNIQVLQSISMKKRTPGPTYPEQTKKPPLLPSPPAPISSHKKHNLPRPLFRDSQYHCKQCISRPHSATSIKQWPPLLPNPTILGPHCATSIKQWPPLLPTPLYHYTMQMHYESNKTEPFQPQIAHFEPQIPVYVPVIMIALTEKFINLIEQHILTHQHHQNTSHQKQ